MKDIRYIIADNMRLYQKQNNLRRLELIESGFLGWLYKTERGWEKNNVIRKLYKAFGCAPCTVIVLFIWLRRYDVGSRTDTLCFKGKEWESKGVFVTYVTRDGWRNGEAVVSTIKRLWRRIVFYVHNYISDQKKGKITCYIGFLTCN